MVPKSLSGYQSQKSLLSIQQEWKLLHFCKPAPVEVYTRQTYCQIFNLCDISRIRRSCSSSPVIHKYNTENHKVKNGQTFGDSKNFHRFQISPWYSLTDYLSVMIWIHIFALYHRTNKWLMRRWQLILQDVILKK